LVFVQEASSCLELSIALSVFGTALKIKKVMVMLMETSTTLIDVTLILPNMVCLSFSKLNCSSTVQNGRYL
jgi:hypothetical protein